MLGQDQNALLLSLRTCPKNNCSNPIFTVFGLPKSTIYSGQEVEFDAFQVDSLTAPVTNAGQPIIASPASFFLAAVPGTGDQHLHGSDLGIHSGPWAPSFSS